MPCMHTGTDVTGIAARLNEPARIRVIETRSKYRGHVVIMQHSVKEILSITLWNWPLCYICQPHISHGEI